MRRRSPEDMADALYGAWLIHCPGTRAWHARRLDDQGRNALAALARVRKPDTETWRLLCDRIEAGEQRQARRQRRTRHRSVWNRVP